MSVKDVCQRGIPCKIGEYDVEVRMLTDDDFADFDVWVSARYIDNARKSAEGLSAVDWDRVMTLAMGTALGLTWLKMPGRSVLKTLAGQAYLAWLSVRASAPKGLTLKTLTELVTADQGDCLDEFYIAFKTLNHLTGQVDREEAKRTANPQ